MSEVLCTTWPDAPAGPVLVLDLADSYLSWLLVRKDRPDRATIVIDWEGDTLGGDAGHPWSAYFEERNYFPISETHAAACEMVARTLGMEAWHRWCFKLTGTSPSDHLTADVESTS